MASGARSKRTRSSQHTNGEKRTCPICFEALLTDPNRAVRFPCSHAICQECNEGMIKRNDHRCPECRTPREGYTRETADALATEQTMRDWEADGVRAGGPMRVMGVGFGVIRMENARGRRQQQVSTVFLPNQAQNNPFDQIDAFLQRVRPSGSSPRRVTVNVERTFHEAPHEDERRPTPPPRTRRSVRERQRAGTEEGEGQEGEGGEGGGEGEGPPRLITFQTTEAQLPEALRQLVSELTSPGSISSFLEARNRVQ